MKTQNGFTLMNKNERGNYESKEAMAEKIAILFANDQLTKEQYETLMAMLEV